jgi:hypothetical protein
LIPRISGFECSPAVALVGEDGNIDISICAIYITDVIYFSMPTESGEKEISTENGWGESSECTIDAGGREFRMVERMISEKRCREFNL